MDSSSSLENRYSSTSYARQNNSGSLLPERGRSPLVTRNRTGTQRHRTGTQHRSTANSYNVSLVPNLYGSYHEVSDFNQYCNFQSSFENEFHRKISVTIAQYGVRAAAEGDLEYIAKLLSKAADFSSTTKVRVQDLIKICNSDGINMFHAAVIYKRLNIMTKILEYGTEIISDPTDDESEDTSLILAIKHCTAFVDPLDFAPDDNINQKVINCLIQFGADINTANKRGDTPLICAIKFQLLDVVVMLTKTETSLDVNANNAYGATALHYAAAFDKLEIADILLQLHADIFITDKTGKTPFHTACKYGSEIVLKLILEANQDCIARIVRETDNEGNTALMLAKSSLSFSLHNVEILIACGSSLLAFNHSHNRILHFYSSVDDKDFNEKILHKEQSLLSHRNYDLETPLHIAAKYGHKETCFLYAEKGADIYAKDVNGFTPMMNAIAHGHKEVVKVFFAFDYGMDVVVKQGKMLLEWATELGHLSLVEAITESNPTNALEVAYCGSKLIHYVCKLGSKTILQHLLHWDKSKALAQSQTDSDSSLGKGYYPIHVAVYYGHLECVKLLCKYDNDLKVKTFLDNDSPLHTAARHGHLEILKYLLYQGVDAELCNAVEGTPLACAARAGQDGVVVHLLSVGASVNGSVDRYRLKTTPLLLAAREGHSKVVKLLLEDDVDVSFVSEDGQNCLTEAILNGHSSTAFAILNSKHWKKAMQFRNQKNETPMRLLIQYMPKVAELALYHFVDRQYKTNEIGSKEITQIHYCYEFLDDFITPKPTCANIISNVFSWTTSVVHHKNDNNSVLFENVAQDVTQMKAIPTIQDQRVNENEKEISEREDTENWMQQKYSAQNHPLELMVTNKRLALLQSPVVEEMRIRKWKTFGLPVFIFNMILYSLFLALLTAVVLVGPFPQDNMCNVSGCWSAWSSWSSCLDATAGSCSNSFTSFMNRTRECTPGIGNVNSLCQGSDSESARCIEDTSGSVLSLRLNPTIHIAREGDDVTFDCTVTGKPPFNVTWIQNNEANWSRSNNMSLSVSLSFTNLTKESYGNYTCIGSSNITDDVSATAALTSPSCQDQCHFNLAELMVNRTCKDRGLSDEKKSFLTAADILIILFSVCQLCLEAFQFWTRRKKYLLDLENWLEVMVFVLSIVFVSYHLQSNCFCSDRRTWTVGILAVFLGWIDHIIFLRQIPFAGITIGIMYNIFITFLGLVLIGLQLIFAFALPFYMLLTIPGRRTPFSSIIGSMLKTLVMTTGEFEYDTIFNNDQDSANEGLSLFLPELTAIIWVVFIVVMPILFSNLLVGLAVGDTQDERAKAELTKISLQVRLILELEETMSVLRYYAKSTGILFTRNNTWYDFVLGTTKLERREAQLKAWEQQESFQSLKYLQVADPLHELQESVNVHMSSIHCRLNHLEDQISTYFRYLESSQDAKLDKQEEGMFEP